MDHGADYGCGLQSGKFYRRLTEDLSEQVGLFIKYNTPDANGQTQAERNLLAGFDHKTPKIKPREDGLYLWQDFWALNGFRGDGERIKPGDMAAWLALHGRRYGRAEITALEAMDRAYVKALGERRAADHERLKQIKEAAKHGRHR